MPSRRAEMAHAGEGIVAHRLVPPERRSPLVPPVWGLSCRDSIIDSSTGLPPITSKIDPGLLRRAGMALDQDTRVRALRLSPRARPSRWNPRGAPGRAWSARMDRVDLTRVRCGERDEIRRDRAGPIVDHHGGRLRRRRAVGSRGEAPEYDAFRQASIHEPRTPAEPATDRREILRCARAGRGAALRSGTSARMQCSAEGKRHNQSAKTGSSYPGAGPGAVVASSKPRASCLARVAVRFVASAPQGSQDTQHPQRMHVRDQYRACRGNAAWRARCAVTTRTRRRMRSRRDVPAGLRALARRDGMRILDNVPGLRDGHRSPARHRATEAQARAAGSRAPRDPRRRRAARPGWPGLRPVPVRAHRPRHRTRCRPRGLAPGRD